MSNDNHLPKWRALPDREDTARHAARAMKAAERVMYDAYAAGDLETALKAATRLQQCARTYLTALEEKEGAWLREVGKKMAEQEAGDGAPDRAQKLP